MLNLIKKFRDGLKKTTAQLARTIKRIVLRDGRLDEDDLDALEATLIGTDIGVDTTQRIMEQVRESALETGEANVFAIARSEIERELKADAVSDRNLKRAVGRPTVVLMVGVNGTGKTTSTAKLAHWFKQQGNSVLLAACDTFRAAAIEQLKIWADRTGCEIVAAQYGADSAAVAYDALGAAVNRGVDYLIVDTAGRLHTKVNLMEEMKKMRRSLQKRMEGTPDEVLLVLDATTGSNALAQVKEFHQALGVTGLIVTKLDGTAKGGIVVAIARQLKIPVKFVGLGEQVDDLQPFDPLTFAEALFDETNVGAKN